MKEINIIYTSGLNIVELTYMFKLNIIINNGIFYQ